VKAALARIEALPKTRFQVYLKLAEEFSEQMDRAASAKAWNSAGLLGVHCVISACDALTVAVSGQRWSGQDHAGVHGVVRSLRIPGGSWHFARLLPFSTVRIGSSAKFVCSRSAMPGISSRTLTGCLPGSEPDCPIELAARGTRLLPLSAHTDPLSEFPEETGCKGDSIYSVKAAGNVQQLWPLPDGQTRPLS
jgi:hypothetical protein